MDRDALCQLLKERYELLSKQERVGANYILENPNEVAVVSMRDLARLANVPPSTMTRLAKRVGLPGYDSLKAAFVDAMRSQGYAYSGRAQQMVQLNRRIGGHAHVQDLASEVIEHIRTLCHPENVATIVRAARRLAKARQIYCLGLRSSFAVGYQFEHVASYFAGNVRLIDGAGESGVMAVIHQASQKDVAIVCSMSRYAKKTISIASHLHQQGVAIIAITDSPMSPVGRLAKETILVRNKTSSFFDTIVPAVLVSEILVMLLSAESDVDVESLVSSAEEKLIGLGEWWDVE
jgi:DNA-binding MurR/RpiR family transcriptional regulator